MFFQTNAHSDAYNLLMSGGLSPERIQKLIQAIWKFVQDLTTCLKELKMYFFDGKLENIGVIIDEDGEFQCFLLDIGGLTDARLIEEGRPIEITTWYQPFWPDKGVEEASEKLRRINEQVPWTLALLTFSLGASCRPGFTIWEKHYDEQYLISQYKEYLREDILEGKRPLNKIEEALANCVIKLFLNGKGSGEVTLNGGTPDTRKIFRRAGLPLQPLGELSVNTLQHPSDDEEGSTSGRQGSKRRRLIVP